MTNLENLYLPAGLELFRGFLMSEHSDENIEFWVACENYKVSKSNKMAALATKIFEDYVAVQSKHEVSFYTNILIHIIIYQKKLLIKKNRKLI